MSALREVVPALRSAGEPERAAYAADLWPRRLIELRDGRRTRCAPAVVVWPEDQEDIARIVEFARREGVPLVPYGAGSDVCGAIAPDERSIVVDLKRMRRWHIADDARSVVCDPGVLGIGFEEELARRGFTVGHFPSSILCSTVGGWVAARGAGQCSSRYGKIEDMVVSAECVFGTGEVATLCRRRNGPSPLSLVIGSEGTLGFLTKIELRLHPAPAHRVFVAMDFGTVGAALGAMRRMFQEGLRPAVARLYDPLDSWLFRRGAVASRRDAPVRRRRLLEQNLIERVVRRAFRASAAVRTLIEQLEKSERARSTLILVFEGTDEGELGADAARAKSSCADEGGLDQGPRLAEHWFEHRYSISYRQSHVFRAGAFNDTLEVAAPWSNLEHVYHSVRHALGDDALVMAHFSHAYPDGSSIYFTFASAGRDDLEAERVYDRIWQKGLRAALDAGATLSHHHGIGRSKTSFLDEALGGGAAVLSRVLRAWDPSGILNPGCLLPTREISAPSRRETPPRDIAIDDVSLLVAADGSTPLHAVETALAARGLELGLDTPVRDGIGVGDWVAEGFPGTRDVWADPVDQVLAGFEAHVRDLPLALAPAPRRATGPDLGALFVGTRGELGMVDRATLRVRRRGVPEARTLPFERDGDAPPSAAEERAWKRVVAAFREP